MTEDQAKVLMILINISLKVVVAICILVGFFIVLYQICTATETTDKLIFSALDSVLGFTMYPLTKHFFPAIKEANKPE